MTREEQAIEYIKKYRELDEKLYNTAPKGTVSSIATKKCLEFWDMAIQALSQEPTVTSTDEPMTMIYPTIVCDDAVSRQAVINAIENDCMKGGLGSCFACYNDAQAFRGEIEKLPSVTQKSGKWIEMDGYDGDVYYDCSECGESWTTIEGTPWDNGMKFCPNCGAKMVEPQESEEQTE